MGIFAKIKELFNKNIECDGDMNSHIVYFLKKKKFLYLNKNIIVRDGTTCVVVYKAKVADVLLAGKYKINEQSIPETYKRAKVEKLNKKGSKIKRIRVDLYFVSNNEFKDFDFDSDEPIECPVCGNDAFWEGINYECEQCGWCGLPDDD